MLEQNSIGKNIKAFREAAGKTQREVANAANIPSSQISAYETGARTPNIDTLASIAKALNKSIDELYYGKSTKTATLPDGSTGRLVVDCILNLFQNDIIGSVIEGAQTSDQYGRVIKLDCLELRQHLKQIKRFITFLYDFEQSRDTFSNPENHLNEMCESVANEIDAGDYLPF